MKLLVLLLVTLWTSRAEAQGFVCGFRPASESEGVPKGVSGATGDVAEQDKDAFYRSGTIHPVIVFGKFKDQEAPINLRSRLKTIFFSFDPFE